MNTQTKLRVVVCAANRSRKTERIVCGARHWDDTMRQQALNGSPTLTDEWRGAEQGFIDQWGRFMTRKEAWVVAETAGQIKYAAPFSKGVLYSEDLY
jgi:hypothetical protein